MSILEQSEAFAKEGNYKAAAQLIKDNWDNYEEVLEPEEEALMDFWSTSSLDCVLELEYEEN